MQLLEIGSTAIVPAHVTHVTVAKHSFRAGWAVQVHLVSGRTVQELVTDEDKAKYRFEQVKKHLKNYS